MLTKIFKANTFEQWRQSTNEISLHLGNSSELNALLANKTHVYTAAADQTLFEGSGSNANDLAFNLIPDAAMDNTGGYIILKDSPTIPASFVPGATLNQGADYSAIIVSASDKKILVKNSVGTFNSGEDLNVGVDSIDAANVARIIAESYAIGAVRVFKEGVELDQNLEADGFHIPVYNSYIELTGVDQSTIDDFIEGETVFQGTNLPSATWSGVVLYADTDVIRLKSQFGTFSSSVQIKVTNSASAILGANHGDLFLVEPSIGSSIELNTPADASDEIKIVALDLVEAINELQNDIGSVQTLTTTSKVLAGAINEHDAELGTITAGSMGTTASTVSGAIREHEDQIGNVNINNIASTITGSLKQLHDEIGDAVLTTAAPTLSAAINEHDSEIGTVSSLTTTSKVLVGAVNELDAKQGNAVLDTAASNLSAAVNELHTEVTAHDIELGTITALAMGTTASTVSGAIKEHEDQIGNVNITGISQDNNTITGALKQLHDEVGESALTTTAQTLSGAINEHDAEIGTVSTLTTTSKVLVGAVNELDAKQGNAALATSAADLSGAVNELHTEVNQKINASSGSPQTLNTGLTFSTGNIVTFPENTTLDIRDGSLLIGGGSGSELSFDTAFLELTAASQLRGLTIERGANDAAIQWNEASVGPRAWELVGVDESLNPLTADIVTFYNAKDLVANNTESGINVTWDAVNQNFDFDVNDPVITIGGHASGSATMTNLGNTTINVTVSNVNDNAIALGTKTTGNYVATIAGTSNEIEVSGSGSETAAVTIGLPNNVTITNDFFVGRDLDVTRNAKIDGTLTVDGNVTLGNATTDTVTIAGNLIVQGDQTILNTATLEVEDSIIITNAANQAVGEFGLAVEGTTDGVIEHTLYYNYTSGQWEADGNKLLDVANLGSPTIGGLEYQVDDNLAFASGAGISQSTAKVGDTITHTITNTDRGSSQNIFKTISSNSGSTTANSNTDTLTVAGGTFITTSISGDTLTISHTDTSSQASVNNSNGVVIQDIFLDGAGHITSIGSVNLDARYHPLGTYDNYSSWRLATAGTVRDNITSNEIVNFVAGGAISVGYSSTNNTITISHTDTSAQSSVNNSNGVVIQDITLDTYGHITSIGSIDLDTLYQPLGTYDNYSYWNLRTDGTSRLNVTSANYVSFNGGSGISVGYASNAVTISHADTSSVGNLSASGRRYVTGLTFDTYGHVTGVTTGTETVVNTDTNYYVSGGSYSAGTLTLTRAGLSSLLISGFPTNNNQLTNGAGYVTSAGSVAYATSAGSASNVAWDNVSGKPTTFTPSAHTHTIANITGLQTALDGKAPLNGSGASGTWGINITGNAATATSATSATSASSATVASTVDNLNSASNLTFWTGTTAQYNAIGTKNANTLYFITD